MGDAVTIGQIIGGGGVGLGSILWFVRWLCEFLAKRVDHRSDKLDVREAALAARYDARLRHLESELSRTRRAVALLMQDIARTNPTSPALLHAAELLMPLTNPVTDPDPAMDEALEKLNDAD
jgi:hypothetical protein